MSKKLLNFDPFAAAFERGDRARGETDAAVAPRPEPENPEAWPQAKAAGRSEKAATATSTHHSPPPTTPHQSPPPTQAKTNPSPNRDYNKRANSLDRDAMPAGLFPGSTFKVYNALYLRSLGAVVPSRKVRASRRDFLDWTDIRNLKTIDGHLRYLTAKGLLVRHWELGSTEGSEYEIYLPEQVLPPLPTTPHHSPPVGTSQKTGSGNTQFLGSGGDSQGADSQATSGGDKTYKTNTEKIDDEAFADMVELLKTAGRELTGKESSAADAVRWKEVAEVLVAELKTAAGRTTISSAPAFLAEHLKRRLRKAETTTPRAPRADPDQPRPATSPPPSDDELIGMYVSFLHSGMTVEEVEQQLVDPQRWPGLKAAVLARYEADRPSIGTFTHPPSTARPDDPLDTDG